jgi:indolepyruvate ferredoxin oxidoreductase
MPPIAFTQRQQINRVTAGFAKCALRHHGVRQELRTSARRCANWDHREIAAKIGLRLYKIGMPWPLEPEGVHSPSDLKNIHRRGTARDRRGQVKQELFNWRDDIARASSARWTTTTSASHHRHVSSPRASSLTEPPASISIPKSPKCCAPGRLVQRRGAGCRQAPVLRAYFCSGCPHNTSTKVPENVRLRRHRLPLHGAVDGPQHRTYTHMGSRACRGRRRALRKEKHVFANLATILLPRARWRSVRQCLQLITYKLLITMRPR